MLGVFQKAHISRRSTHYVGRHVINLKIFKRVLVQSAITQMKRGKKISETCSDDVTGETLLN